MVGMARQSQTDAMPRHNEYDYGLDTALDNYRYVLSVDPNADTEDTRIVVKGEASTYDIDAIVGLCVRKFGLTFNASKDHGEQIALWFDH